MDSARFDFLVIGSGLAGLAFALSAAEHGNVCILTKAELTESNTSYAQGGIAAAVGEADSWELHEHDTLVAGAGLCDRAAVRFLVQNAPDAIDWLVKLGARFDQNDNGDFALGREGGHARHRIVHHADRTGWEIERAVSEAAKRHPRIKFVEHAYVTHLRTLDGRVVGAEAQIDGLGARTFLARAVLLATGGCGRMYTHTTNPRVATGDGIGLADAVGARIEGMEFMQFHPTTLYHSQLRSFLITEAVRGAGGTLRNHNGRRFMYDYDPRLELAPRDVVSRAIEAEMRKLDTWCVYLDVTHLTPDVLKDEFPTIWDRLRTIDIEMEKDWIPIVPAQHYSCGGVVTDLDGRTSVPGLFAAGEVACTGVHGANRLASNSLLEALVFARAAAAAAPQEPEADTPEPAPAPPCFLEEDAVRLRRSLQRAMTTGAGIVRTNDGIRRARHSVEELAAEVRELPTGPYSAYPYETRNLIAAAGYVLRGAEARRENVGLHYNRDLDPNC